MKRPNNKGTVYKLKDKPRRKPYTACVTYYENCVLKKKYLGFFATKKEALECLDAFNLNPYDVNKSKVTFQEIYKLWKEKALAEGTGSQSRITAYTTAFQKFTPLYDKPIRDLHLADLQRIFDEMPMCSKSTFANMLKLLHALYKYALKYEYIEKDHSQFIELPATTETKEKTIFSEAEINQLWKLSETDDTAKIIIILLYTGYRVTELLDMPTANINISERLIIGGGKKTKAGKNRTVPIHKRIIPLLEYFLPQAKEKFYPYNYNIFSAKFKKVMSSINATHTIHETRHTFISRMASANVPLLTIKKIVGHASNDITEDIYTHKNSTELISAIDALP